MFSNQLPSSGPDIIQAADYVPSRIARFDGGGEVRMSIAAGRSGT